MIVFDISVMIITVAVMIVTVLLDIYIKKRKRIRVQEQCEVKAYNDVRAHPEAKDRLRFPSKSVIFNANYEVILLRVTHESKVSELSLQNAVKMSGNSYRFINFPRVVSDLLGIAFEKKLISASRFDANELSEHEATYAVFALSLVASALKVDSALSVRLNANVKTASGAPHTLAIVQRMFLPMLSPLYDNVLKANIKAVMNKKVMFDGLIKQSYDNVRGMTV